PAPPEIYTLSLHDALPISAARAGRHRLAPKRTVRVSARAAARSSRFHTKHAAPRQSRRARGVASPCAPPPAAIARSRQHKTEARSEEHTSELQSLRHLVCR